MHITNLALCFRFPRSFHSMEWQVDLLMLTTSKSLTDNLSENDYKPLIFFHTLEGGPDLRLSSKDSCPSWNRVYHSKLLLRENVASPYASSNILYVSVAKLLSFHQKWMFALCCYMANIKWDKNACYDSLYDSLSQQLVLVYTSFQLFSDWCSLVYMCYFFPINVTSVNVVSLGTFWT